MLLNFLADHWGSILIGVLVAAVVVFILVKLVKDKRRGKTSCGCGCDHCPSSGMCHKK